MSGTTAAVPKQYITFDTGEKLPVTHPKVWPAYDILLQSYSMPRLNSEGYLNIPDVKKEDIRPYSLAAIEREGPPSATSSDNSLHAESMYSDDSFHHESSTSAPLSVSASISPDWETKLHPILRRDRWISDTVDFELLRPALQLVTCLLDEPSVIPFFIGLRKDPLPKLNNERAREIYKGHDIYTFEPHIDADPARYRADQIKTWTFLARDMHKLVLWRFGGNSPNSYATTSLLWHVHGPVAGKTFGSRISLDNTYLQALKGNPTPEYFPWRDHLDKESMILRTYFHLGASMLHEISHAVGNATIHRSTNVSPLIQQPEPFFRDDRMYELGMALTQYVFGGIPTPNGPPKETWCHYGLHMRDFPGTYHFDRTDKKYAYKTAEEDGEVKEWHYAVTMDYVQKMFTKKFWDHELRQYDPNMLLRYQHTEIRAWRIPRLQTHPKLRKNASADRVEKPRPVPIPKKSVKKGWGFALTCFKGYEDIVV